MVSERSRTTILKTQNIYEKLSEHQDNIELRSDEVQDILGTPPSWLVRWGTTVIFLGIMALMFLSWLIKYPEIIDATVEISSESPTVSIVARTDGHLAKLLVNDRDNVKTGDILAVMQNTATYEDVILLEEQVKNWLSYSQEGFADMKPNLTYRLGDLQTAYSNFTQAQEIYAFQENKRFDKVNISQLNSQIEIVKRNKKLNQDKINKANERKQLQEEKYKRLQKLYSDNGASLEDLQNEREKLLAFDQEITNIKAEIVRNETEIGTLENQITGIQQNTSEGSTNKFIKVKETLNDLRSQIDTWKQNFLLTAPIDGQVSFYSKIWTEQQFVKREEEMFSIIPQNGNSGRIIAKALMPITNSGKVKEGLKVVIKLENYPYEDNGTLSGVVEKKALMPKDNTYLVLIDLPNGLKTTTGKVLPIEQQLKGTAEIVTENKRFIERVFEQLTAGLKKKYD